MLTLDGNALTAMQSNLQQLSWVFSPQHTIQLSQKALEAFLRMYSAISGMTQTSCQVCCASSASQGLLLSHLHTCRALNTMFTAAASQKFGVMAHFEVLHVHARPPDRSGFRVQGLGFGKKISIYGRCLIPFGLEL